MDARQKRGFTLVELLVVVVIIGILAGLISAAAIRARNQARIAGVVSEISQLELALGQYKEKFGIDYPPDLTDQNAVRMHLAKAFPRYSGASSWTMPSGIDTTNGPTAALVYWLAGPTGNGFSTNPTNPFDTSTPSRIGPFFEFDRTRLQQVGTSSLYKYLPPNNNAKSDPYVYFKARPYGASAVYNTTDSGTGTSLSCAVVSASSAGGTYNVTVKPYKLYQDTSTFIGWVNPTKFQILSPGLDGKYKYDPAQSSQVEPGQKYPVGDDYSKAQYDDVTNFSGGTLESKIP